MSLYDRLFWSEWWLGMLTALFSSGNVALMLLGLSNLLIAGAITFTNFALEGKEVKNEKENNY